MWKTLGFEKCLDKVKTPPKFQKKDYLEQCDFPVVSQEVALVNGYCNESEMLFKVAKPIIVFGDHTQILKCWIQLISAQPNTLRTSTPVYCSKTS